MNTEVVLVIYGLALVLVSSLALCNRLDLRRMERELQEALDGKAPKRRSGPKPRGKRVPVESIIERSPDGKEQIVGGKCTGCDQTIDRKGGHTIAQCERFQEEKKREQPMLAQPEDAPDPAPRTDDPPADPPMDRAPGEQGDPSHDD